MKNKSGIYFVIALILLLMLTLYESPVLSFQTSDQQLIKSLKREFRPAEYCGQCHEEEYSQWLTSSHSRSLISDTFQQLFQQSIRDTNERSRQICLKCHAPAAVFNDDLKMSDSRNVKPVNCEVCHSMTGMNENYKITFDTTGRMFSNRDSNLGEGHKVAKNTYITSSDMCKACHITADPDDKFMTCAQDNSYENWKSITGRSDRCHDCHMRDLYGNVDHSFRGGNNKDMVEGSLEVRWNYTPTGTQNKVRVILHNPDVGHNVPGGMTLRRLIIRVRVLNSDEEEIYNQDATLGKVFEDDEGIWPVMGWKAKKIRFDNAIRPLEKRMIMFNIPIINKARYIELIVLYKRLPNAEESFVIYSDRKVM